MAAEIENQLGGWPFGLESLTFRLRNMDYMQAPATAPNSLHMYSDSFPSYSSSELDTVSTRSFFQDHSITLGSLIGMAPVDRNARFKKSFLPEEAPESSLEDESTIRGRQRDGSLLHLCSIRGQRYSKQIQFKMPKPLLMSQFNNRESICRIL